jgi:hypothetical protein
MLDEDEDWIEIVLAKRFKFRIKGGLTEKNKMGLIFGFDSLTS